MDTRTLIAELRKHAASGDSQQETNNLMLEAAITIERLLTRPNQREIIQPNYDPSRVTTFVYTGPAPTVRFADGGKINMSVSMQFNENADTETVASIVARTINEHMKKGSAK